MLAAPLAALAQTPVRIDTKKGKTYKVTSVTNGEMDMGMGMTMNSKSTNQYQVEVLDVIGDKAILKSTLSRMNIEMDAMGQQQSFDSDKQADRESELGKNIPADAFKPDTAEISLASGALIESPGATKVKTEADDNPMNGMIQAMGESDAGAVAGTLHFIIPAGVKAGDQWKDSSSTKGMKRQVTYTLESIDKNIASIKMDETTQMNSEQEVQGMAMQVSMSGSNKGTLKVNTDTGLIQSKEINSEVNGSLEVMGQSNPISAKNKATLTIE